jgi:hypothetical protein
MLVLLSLAWAECSITLVSPANGSSAAQSPQFRWLGTCAIYRVRVSPSGGFGTSDTT